MPYIIMLVIIVVAAGALLLFNEPAEAPADAPADDETVEIQSEAEATLPEGYTPPTEQPPSLNPGEEENAIDLEIDAEANINESIAPEVAPEAVSAESETYLATASYFTPRRTEHDIEVTLELEGTTVVDANVTYDGGSAQTGSHSSFDSAYAAVVIGQDVNGLELSRVGGASLTSDAFNEAVAEIKAQL